MVAELNRQTSEEQSELELRKEAGLRRSDFINRRMLEMELAGRRPKRRILNVERQDVRTYINERSISVTGGQF